MEIIVPSLLRIKPNALHKLGKYLRNESFSQIALFYGEGLKPMLAETVEISLASSEIKIAHEGVAASNDIEVIFQDSLFLPQKLDAIVAIGGGKVIDCCKYLALLKQIPLVSVPTLISNDGFSSPFSSLVVKGARRTVRTVFPTVSSWTPRSSAPHPRLSSIRAWAISSASSRRYSTGSWPSRSGASRSTTSRL
jgi:glycerol-1-phosphate dehydrogenase [NAD(P)+]